jgi:hypothetical protein
LQLKSQVLFAQVATPLSGVGHLVPHAPQLLGFVAVATHCSPHFVSPGLQLATHVGVPDPLEQSGAVDGHTMEQPPQCCGPTSTHAPSQTSWSVRQVGPASCAAPSAPASSPPDVASVVVPASSADPTAETSLLTHAPTATAPIATTDAKVVRTANFMAVDGTTRVAGPVGAQTHPQN